MFGVFIMSDSSLIHGIPICPSVILFQVVTVSVECL